MLLRRMVQIGVCAALLFTWLPAAQSARKTTCASAWRDAKSLIKSGQLRQAKSSMLRCAVAACGARLRQECAQRVAEIEGEIPTIVPVVKDSGGNPLTELKMMMDGELVADKIDGRAVAVDPGPHQFTFEGKRGVLASYKTVILKGQRNRTMEVTLGAWGREPVVKTRVPPGFLAPSMKGADTPAFNLVYDEETSGGGTRIGAGTYALAAVGALGLAGYGLTTYQGNRENKRLDLCSPNCSQASVDRIRRMYLVGRISLGVGAAALLGATYLFFTSDSGTSELAMRGPGYRLDVQPAAAGGLATWSGSF
jgi:hypothetical protein